MHFIRYQSQSSGWQLTLAGKTIFTLILACLTLIGLALVRFVALIRASHALVPPRRSRSSHQHTHLLIVLGSGGHTSEMLAMLKRAQLSPKLYTHRTYVVSSGDGFSAEKAKGFEESITQANLDGEQVPAFDIKVVPRARKIHQPLLTTPLSSLVSLLACIQLLYNHPAGYPDLILTNGPGTGVIVVVASLILKFFAIRSKHSRTLGSSSQKSGTAQMRTIFIESWARVRTLSFSGKILLPIVDRFLVQWKGLEGMGKRAEYAGFLI